MPFDFGEGCPERGDFRGILAVELSHLQAKLTESTENVVVILDCCHSARMSRGQGARPRAAPKATKWTNIVDTLVRRAIEDQRVAEARFASGNPNAVRLVACAQDEQAFEHTGGGYFTQSLVRSLAAAREGQPTTWRQLLTHVRSTVLSAGYGQRPEVEGPADRRLFSIEALSLTGVLPVATEGGKILVHGGSLMGLERGDTYVIMGTDALQADEARAWSYATVGHVGLTSATLHPQRTRFGPLPQPAHAFPSAKNVRRGVVRVEGDEDWTHEAKANIERSGTLRSWMKGDGPPMATLRRVSGELVICDALDEVWLRPHPDGEPLDRVVSNLEVMARAEALRRLADGTGSDALRVRPTVEWGTVRDGEQTQRAPTNERVREGDKVYVVVANPKQSPTPVFVSIFDVGLTGRVTLLSESGGSGLEIPPGQCAGIGLHPYGGVVGLGPISWPEAAPRNSERPESLGVIATDAPHDLRTLQGPGAKGGPASVRGATRTSLEQVVEWIGRGRTRDLMCEQAVDHHRFAVEHLDFLVEPAPAEPC
jgi:hypothetical protein